MLKAIVNLHEAELIHRDIKTDNVLVRKQRDACLFVSVFSLVWIGVYGRRGSISTAAPFSCAVDAARWTLTGAVWCATMGLRGKEVEAAR